MRKEGVILSVIVASLLIMTTLVTLPIVVEAGMPYYPTGEVEANVTTGVRAYDAVQNGNTACYIRDSKGNGTSTDVVLENLTAGTTDYYWWDAGAGINWEPTENVDDPTVVVINREDGTYPGGDRAGYVTATVGPWDFGDLYPTCQLRKIPVPMLVMNGTDYMNLSWTPLEDPFNIIAGYTIYRSDTNDSDLNWGLVSGDKDAPVTDNYFMDMGLTPGAYYYSIKVIYKGWNEEAQTTVNNYESMYFGEGSGLFKTAPTVDYINITDIPDGTPLAGGTVPVVFMEWGNCSAYNITAGFLGVVDADWTAEGGGASLLGASPAVLNGINVGTTGGVSVWLNASYSGKSNSVQYDVLIPTVDYIQITDIPDGTQLPGGSVPVRFQEMGNCSAYNDTIGYIGTVSADWTVDGGGATLQGPTPAVMNGIEVGDTGGDVWLNASYLGNTYSVYYDVLPPNVDYIIITDVPDGTPLSGGVAIVGFREWGNCSAYNDTIGYMGTVIADWTVGGGGATPLGPTPEVMNGIDVGAIEVDVWLNASYLGKTYSVMYSVSLWTIDYIDITDLPDGTPLSDKTVPVGYREWGNCSAYNTSGGGFLGVVSADWTVGGGNAFTLGVTPDVLNGIDVGTMSVTVWLNASYLGKTDSVIYNIIPITIDYIEITYTPNGTQLMGATVDVGFREWGNCSAYNITSGYIGVVDAVWDADGGTAFLLSATPGLLNGIDVGSAGGTVWFNASYGGKTDSVVYNVNPPTLDYIEITDIPDGTPLTGATVSVGFQELGNCSAYNNTIGFMGTVAADWSVGGGTASLLLGTPAVMNGIDVGNQGVIVWLNASYGGKTDSIQYDVLPPTIDYIEITDLPGGIPLAGGVVLINFREWGNCSTYNNSVGFIGLGSADWTVEGGGASILGATPAVMNGIDVGGTDVDVWLNATFGGESDSVQYTVSLWTVDYIDITKTPDGTPLVGGSANVGFQEMGYCSAYNTSGGGYLGLVNADWTVGGGTSMLLGATPALSNQIDVGSSPVDVWLNASFSGHMDSVMYSVQPPTINYIQIRDAAGIEVTTAIYIVNQVVEFYAAAFNDTIGYLYDVEAVWLSDDTGVGQVTTPGLWTNFTAQQVATDLTCTVTATYMGTIIDTTGLLTVLAPTPDVIEIRDAAGGAGNIVDTATFDITETDMYYAAGINNTVGYIGDMVVTWTISPTSGVGSVGPASGDSTTFTAVGVGTCIVTATYSPTVSDSTGLLTVEDIPPVVSYILIRDQPDGLGNVVTTRTYGVNDDDMFYAASYDSDDNYLGDVEVTWSTSSSNVGAIDTTTGIQTNFTAQQVIIDSTCTITATYASLSPASTGDLKVLAPTVDEIRIVDTSSTGTTDIADQTAIVGFEITGYAASFNDTIGYLGDILATWSVVNTLGATATTFPTTGFSSEFDAELTGGTGTWTADDGDGHTDTVVFTITPPTVDSIIIRDAPNDGGIEVETVNYLGGNTDTFYAAAYNDTTDYLYDVEVTWACDVTTVGQVDLLGLMTNFTAQTVSVTSTCTVTATYSTDISDSTGLLTVLLTVTAPDPPEKPTLSVKGTDKIQISWTPNTESDIEGYMVYRRESPDDEWEFIGVPDKNTTTYTDKGLEPDTKYYYMVTAVDVDGFESEPSPETSATTDAEDEFPWIWLLLFLIIVIVVLLLVFIMYKKRRKEEEAPPPVAAPAAAPAEEAPMEEEYEEEAPEEDYEEEAPAEEEYEEEAPAEEGYEEEPVEEEPVEEEYEEEPEEPTAPPTPPPPPPPPPA